MYIYNLLYNIRNNLPSIQYKYFIIPFFMVTLFYIKKNNYKIYNTFSIKNNHNIVDTISIKNNHNINNYNINDTIYIKHNYNISNINLNNISYFNKYNNNINLNLNNSNFKVKNDINNICNTFKLDKYKMYEDFIIIENNNINSN